MSDPYLPPGCTNRDIDGPKAAQEGCDAYADGLDLDDDNPYNPEDYDYDLWREGWQEAWVREQLG
jgi:hypothetical protein